MVFLSFSIFFRDSLDYMFIFGLVVMVSRGINGLGFLYVFFDSRCVFNSDSRVFCL